MTIALHPIPEINQSCPQCAQPLQVLGWYMPGMRSLAELFCPRCITTYYGDLPVGHGLRYPMLLDKVSGEVYGAEAAPWFADWLRLSYARRCANPVSFEVDEFKPVRQGLLLNCLDRLYGHGLLKLLNAQYYLDRRPDLDLVVIVPRALRWLVPDGVAAVWTVNESISRANVWNDWLAQEFRRRVSQWETCALSVAYSHPHPSDVSIGRFSRVEPFPLDEWEARLQKPVVTFISRDDRLWASVPSSQWGLWLHHKMNRLLRLMGAGAVVARMQDRSIIELARCLRKFCPSLDMAVAGIGRKGRMPAWLKDLRLSTAPDPAQERALCDRYARSHLVIGVHGSNMLLPSAHAGAVIELVPQDRWGNLIQDLLIRSDDQRETLFRYRLLSLNSSPQLVAKVAASLLLGRADFARNMELSWCTRGTVREVSDWREAKVTS